MRRQGDDGGGRDQAKRGTKGREEVMKSMDVAERQREEGGRQVRIERPQRCCDMGVLGQQVGD